MSRTKCLLVPRELWNRCSRVYESNRIGKRPRDGCSLSPSSIYLVSISTPLRFSYITSSVSSSGSASRSPASPRLAVMSSRASRASRSARNTGKQPYLGVASAAEGC